MNDEKGARVAALDLGSVRVGLAVSDELGMLAHPRKALPGRDPKALLAALVRLAREENIGLFVVGLPRSLSGVEGPPARRARAFAKKLQAELGCRVELLDERLSTIEAQARLREQGLNEKKSRERIDSAAAAVLLQAWLNQNGGGEGGLD
jgi:putative Holliday junction resolvase